MKLELKHIACYLPFDLQYKGEYGGVSTMRKLEYCRPYNKETDSFTDEIGVDGYFIQYIKPLLLPISCLTEEIEHNGERFVPIDWLNENKDVRLIRGRDSRGNRIVFNERTNTANIRFWEYCIIEKLAEYHIDFQGLIPAGLAVDKREVG